MEFVKKDICWI